jgi:hypothetical protein
MREALDSIPRPKKQKTKKPSASVTFVEDIKEQKKRKRYTLLSIRWWVSQNYDRSLSLPAMLSCWLWATASALAHSRLTS